MSTSTGLRPVSRASALAAEPTDFEVFGLFLFAPGRDRVVTHPDVHVSVRRTSGRVRQPHGCPLDGMPSATLLGGRHGRRPSDCWTACRLPPHSADGMADGHPTAGRPLQPSAGWRTAAPSAGRGGCRTAWRTPPPGPSARGRPPGAVCQRPSARGRSPSQNFQKYPPSPIFPYVLGTLVALDPWGGMILKIRDPKAKEVALPQCLLPHPYPQKCIFLVLIFLPFFVPFIKKLKRKFNSFQSEMPGFFFSSHSFPHSMWQSS
jgi:hypothetical protein